MKGQSAIAVKKEAGISYVKPTESRQLRVGDNYQRLSATTFQCSYSLKPAKIESNLVCNFY